MSWLSVTMLLSLEPLRLAVDDAEEHVTTHFISLNHRIVKLGLYAVSMHKLRHLELKSYRR